MLVLGRTKGESIVVGDYEVVVTIIDIRGSHVRVGIQAAKEIPVGRLELKQLKDKEALGTDAAQEAEQGCSGLE